MLQFGEMFKPARTGWRSGFSPFCTTLAETVRENGSSPYLQGGFKDRGGDGSSLRVDARATNAGDEPSPPRLETFLNRPCSYFFRARKGIANN